MLRFDTRLMTENSIFIRIYWLNNGLLSKTEFSHRNCVGDTVTVTGPYSSEIETKIRFFHVPDPLAISDNQTQALAQILFLI